MLYRGVTCPSEPTLLLEFLYILSWVMEVLLIHLTTLQQETNEIYCLLNILFSLANTIFTLSGTYTTLLLPECQNLTCLVDSGQEQAEHCT